MAPRRRRSRYPWFSATAIGAAELPAAPLHPPGAGTRTHRQLGAVRATATCGPSAPSHSLCTSLYVGAFIGALGTRDIRVDRSQQQHAPALHADRRADFVTLAKENRVFRVGRFAWPFRRAKGPLLYFCRWCATICAPRGRFYQLFGQDGRVSFALSRGKNMCHGPGLRFRPRTHIYASRLEETAWYHF